MAFLFPLDKCYLTQGFHDRHLANDYGWLRVWVVDPPVYSIGDGVVIASYYSTAGGNIVVVLDKQTSNAHWYQTRYVHLKTRAFKVGEIVNRGDIIGIGNNSGTNTTGPHLHIEVLIVPYGYSSFVWQDNLKYAIDPKSVMFIKNGQPVTGEGIKVMELEKARNPVAIPFGDKLRMRSSPSVESLLNVVGRVPVSGLVFLGKTNDIEGFLWAKMLLEEDKIVWAAIEKADKTATYMYIKEEEKIVYIEIPTVKTIDITTIEDGAEVRLQVNPVLK